MYSVFISLRVYIQLLCARVLNIDTKLSYSLEKPRKEVKRVGRKSRLFPGLDFILYYMYTYAIYTV